MVIQRYAMLAVCTLLITPFARAEVLATDDFESSSRSDVWGYFNSAEVVPLPASTGRDGSALRFRFDGGSDSDDSFSEARFELDDQYREITIDYDLFIPDNYNHRRPNSGPSNNKFFRMWHDSYNGKEKVGASMLASSGGNSSIGTDYSVQADWSISTGVETSSGFITDEDLGNWVEIRISVLAPSAVNKGRISIYKNGHLILDDNDVPNNVSNFLGYKKGYLLGWANSGFDQDTVLYIDNVRFINSADAPPVPPGSPIKSISN